MDGDSTKGKLDTSPDKMLLTPALMAVAAATRVVFSPPSRSKDALRNCCVSLFQFEESVSLLNCGDIMIRIRSSFVALIKVMVPTCIQEFE